MTDDAPMPRTARVVLLGMMGSGKSSVGRALAQRTGWQFVDNDELVERATGRTARELLHADGEAVLRDAESQALRTGLSLEPPIIVATAAGTVLDDDDRALIDRGGFVVWLRAPAELLAARAAGAAHRPWLQDDPVGWFTRTLAERDPLYAQVADLTIDTTVSQPSDSAERIVAALSAGG